MNKIMDPKDNIISVKILYFTVFLIIVTKVIVSAVSVLMDNNCIDLVSNHQSHPRACIMRIIDTETDALMERTRTLPKSEGVGLILTRFYPCQIMVTFYPSLKSDI